MSGRYSGDWLVQGSHIGEVAGHNVDGRRERSSIRVAGEGSDWLAEFDESPDDVPPDIAGRPGYECGYGVPKSWWTLQRLFCGVKAWVLSAMKIASRRARAIRLAARGFCSGQLWGAATSGGMFPNSCRVTFTTVET